MAPITLEQMQSFKAPMLSRNPRLHAVFNTMGLAEERGLGLQSMHDRTRDAALPLPTFSWDEPYLNLTVYRRAESATTSLDEMILSKLNGPERKGWTFITGKGTTTQNEYSTHMGITPRTAQRHLSHFVQLELLHRIGRGPSTEYRVAQQ